MRCASGEFPWPCYKDSGAKDLAKADLQPGDVLVQQFCGWFYIAPSVETLCSEIVNTYLTGDSSLLRLCEAYSEHQPVKFCIDLDDEAVLRLLDDRMGPEFAVWNKLHKPLGTAEFLLTEMAPHQAKVPVYTWKRAWSGLVKAVDAAPASEHQALLQQVRDCALALLQSEHTLVRDTLTRLRILLASLAPAVYREFRERWQQPLEAAALWLCTEARQRVQSLIAPFAQLELSDILFANSSAWNPRLLCFKLSFHIVVPAVAFPNNQHQLEFHRRVTIPTQLLPVDESILVGDRVLRMLFCCKGQRNEGMVRPLIPFEVDGTPSKPTWQLVCDFMVSQPSPGAVLLPQRLPVVETHFRRVTQCTLQEADSDPELARLLPLLKTGKYADAHFALRRTAGGKVLAVTDSRWCANKGGEHNGNRVYFLIDRDGITQRCLCQCDVRRKYGLCKRFVGAPKKLPHALKLAVFGRPVYPFAQ